MSEKVNISIRMDKDLHYKISREAILNSVSKNQIINNHLKASYRALKQLAHNEWLGEQVLFKDLYSKQVEEKLFQLHFLFSGLENLRALYELKKVLKDDETTNT